MTTCTRTLAALIVTTAVAAVVLPIAGDRSAAPEPVRPAATSRPAPLNHDPGVAYVGREACKRCHEGNYATYAKTGMGRSFYPMASAKIVEDWTDENTFTDPRTGLHYRMFRRDGKFWQRQFVRGADGRELAADEHELVYAVGSNNHSRGYIVLRDDRLFQAPVCWDPTEEFWMYCPGFELKNDHFGREISYRCLFCHNGRVELVEGERNLFRKPLSHGIGCERCHGPGELHAGTRKPPEEDWDLVGQADPTIVNPSRLPPTERIHVCFQCHLGDSTATVRVIRHDRSLADFRPGMQITDVLVPFRYEQQSLSHYSLVSQADRLLLSRCYQESGGKLECLTCHNPHITVYGKPQGSFRDNCMICHDSQACSAPVERRAGTNPADDCVACHMRRAEPVDRKHSLFTDHWIRRDALDPPVERRTQFELEPVFPEIFAGYPPGERAYYRARAHFLRSLEALPQARQYHWERAEEAFREAIATGFDEVEAWFFLGKLHMYRQQWRDAARAFRSAAIKDPTHHDAAFALGQSLSVLGRTDEARSVFSAMLERDPSDPMALAELARMRWSLQEFPAAVGLYRKAIAEEPWNPSLHLNLGMTLASVGRMNDAVNAGLEAVRLNPDDPELWSFLRNAGREAGRDEVVTEAVRQLGRLRPGSR